MSLYYRQDWRSLEDFSKDIKRYHKLEDLWSTILAAHYLEADNVDSVEVVPFGSDGKGKVQAKVTNKPDYQYSINYVSGHKRVKYIEVKSHRKIKVCDYYTYKLSSLEGCIKHNGRIFTPDSDTFIEIPPKSLKEIIAENQPQQYISYAPMKMAIRLSKDEIQKYIDSGIIRQYKWNNKASAIIKKKYKELFYA